MLRTVLALLAALSFWGCGRDEGAQPAGAPPSFGFVDVAAASGLRTSTWCGSKDKPHLLEGDGSGVALFDYDGDGVLDLYLVNAWRLDGGKVVDRGGDRLFRNRGDGAFEDVTAGAGLGQKGWGSGVAVGDIDNDGWPDLFLTNFGPNVLYRNNGDGTFAQVQDAPSIDNWASGACFFDANGDGFLDLYICGYVNADLKQVLNAKPTLDWKKLKVMLGPFGLEGLEDQFYANRGNGTFRLATKEAGLEDTGKFFGYTAVAFDMDGDGDLDLYVSNDSNPNYLYRNDGKGHFKEVGLWSGAALDTNGMGQASMGVAVADFDQDDRPDIFVANFAEDFSTLYRNLGRGLFVDESDARGVGRPTYEPLSWGTAFIDFDLDGDLDLFVANGHLYPQANLPGTATSFEQKNLILESDGKHFRDASRLSGPGLDVKLSSRGLAAGDIDLDGDIDLVITNIDKPPTLLRNDSPRKGAWLIVDAPGARHLEVTAAGRKIFRHCASGGSYKSVCDSRFHVGLGPVETVERVAVRWADGHESVLSNIRANRVIRVLQGAPATGMPCPR